MTTPAFNQTDRTLLQGKHYALEQVGEGEYIIIRPGIAKYKKHALGLFVAVFIGTLCYMMFSDVWGQWAFAPALIVGAILVLFAVVVGFTSIMSLLGLGRDYWRIAPGKVEYCTQILLFTHRRTAVKRIVELAKDEKTKQYYLRAAKTVGSYLFTEHLPFDVSYQYDELSELGKKIADITGWPYVESEMDLRSSVGHGGG